MNKNILKHKLLIVFTTILLALGYGCNQFLDEAKPLNKISDDQLFASEKGILTLLAEIYNSMPMEDFNYHPESTASDGGFYIRAIGTSFYAATTDMYTDDAMRSDGQSSFNQPGNNYFEWAYIRIRNLNLFLESLGKAKESQVLSEAKYTLLLNEAYFVRAYLYYGLAKRYGGVPILENALDNVYIPGTDNSGMFVPRSTEKETWDFALSDIDKAIANLPETNAEGQYRVDKWVAYALKSRIALHAASVAKFWDNAPLAGSAVSSGYIGLSASDANRYYSECISASKAIIDGGKYALYMPNPVNPAAAAENFQNLFLTPNSETSKNSEIIYSRPYLDGTIVSSQGHSYDAFMSPSQSHPGYLRHGRFSVTLDLVDAFEDYTDDGTGASKKIVTREDGNEDFYYLNPNNVEVSVPFKKYDDLFDPFVGKDARLYASIIVPGAMYKGTKIVIQGGLIRKNGGVVAYAAGSETGHDGKMYYTYGAESRAGYSGYDNLGLSYENSNYTCTGFIVRKYLSENKNLVVTGGTQVSTTPWIDFRLAEIYLNYAEATVESGQGDATLARSYINQLRKRAGHTDEIPLTLQNVMKERRVEMAFEGRRFDDMLRRREYHTFWNTVGVRRALVPMIDLRETTPKYIFVRVNQFHDERDARVFATHRYYKEIPGTNNNNLVQNPGY